MSNLVDLEYLDNYEIDKVQHALETSFFNLEVEAKLKNLKKVLLKVCLPCDASPDSAEITNPTIVRAIVNILSNWGVKCVVADSPYGSFSNTYLDRIYLNSGLLEVANQTNCELNHNLKTFNTAVPNGDATKSLSLLDIVNEVDAIINVSKLKIHSNLAFVGSTANLFGLIPGQVKTLYLNRLKTLKDFYAFNLDVYQHFQNKIVLNVVDAIVAMEANNTPRLVSCLGVSENSCSLDAAMLDILNINYNNTYLKQAHLRALINIDKPYKLSGEKIEKFHLEDFALTEFNEGVDLHKNESERKRYFNATQKRVAIKGKKCKGCGICSKICPTNALAMKYDKNGELYTVVDYNKCIFCYKCVTACPYKVVDILQPAKNKKLTKEIEKYNND